MAAPRWRQFTSSGKRRAFGTFGTVTQVTLAVDERVGQATYGVQIRPGPIVAPADQHLLGRHEVG